MPLKDEMSEGQLIVRIEQFISACYPKAFENYYLFLFKKDSSLLNEEKLTSKFIQGNKVYEKSRKGNIISIDISLG